MASIGAATARLARSKGEPVAAAWGMSSAQWRRAASW